MSVRPNIIIGAGPIGRAVALQMAQLGFGALLIIDRNPAALTTTQHLLGEASSDLRFTSSLNAKDIIKAVPQSIIFATSWKDCRDDLYQVVTALRGVRQRVPVICVGRPALDDPLIRQLDPGDPPVILGAGLEPGLVEALISLTLSEIGDLQDLSTYCGGIPIRPVPPLNYELSFGQKLPIDLRPTYARIDWRTVTRTRSEDVASLFVEGIGVLEAFDDGLLNSTAISPDLRVANLRQRTLRWPGFTDAVRSLHRLGLLGDEEIEFGTLRTTARNIVEQLLSRNVPTKTHPSDQVILSLEIMDSREQRGSWSLVIRAAPHQQTSAMARATALPAAASSVIAQGLDRGGPILPHDPALAEVASTTLSWLRGHPNIQVVEHASGLLKASRTLGGSHEYAENTLGRLRTSKPGPADLP
jgi:saccharopine dehydrogenase-like NADP-dependent oxidoreductase